jgi:hypothetical protein
MTKRYRSNVLAAIHEIALGLFEAGVMDARAFEAFDRMCLGTAAGLAAGGAGQAQGKPGPYE